MSVVMYTSGRAEGVGMQVMPRIEKQNRLRDLRRALLGPRARSSSVRSTHAPGRSQAVQQTTTMLEPSSPAHRRAAARAGGRPGCRVTPLQSLLLHRH